MNEAVHRSVKGCRPQTRGSTARCPWRWPLLLSLSLACCAGLYLAYPLLDDQQYFRFHLTYTALRQLAMAMDRSVPYTFVYSALLALIYWGSGRLLRERVKAVRLLIAIIAPVAVVWALSPQRNVLLNEGHQQAGRLLSLWRSAQALLVTPAALCALIAVLALVMALLLTSRRRTAVKASHHESGPGRLQRSITTAALAGLALPAVFFCLINLAAGILHVRNTLALRARPNVIFIMVDTLRADHLGCYGYDLPVSPNLDRLARESTRFEHAVSQASWTLMSVTSLFTSRYPDRLFAGGMSGSNSIGPAGYFPTLAEALHDRGYRTGAIVSNPFLMHTRANTQGYDEYDDHLAFAQSGGLAPEKAQPRASSAVLGENQTFSTSTEVTDLALTYLKRVKNRKFFLYLLYMDPHMPYLQHPGFEYGDARADRRTPISPTNAIGEGSSLAERDKYLRSYNSEIGYTDFHIGRLLDALRRQGVYDNTLIVFFSDHGEEFLEHGQYEHRKTVYEELIQVPLLVKLPGQRQGRVVKGTFPLIDLYPSLLAHLNIDHAALGLQGDAVPLGTLLRSADKPLFSSTYTLASQHIQSVRSGGDKLVKIGDAHPRWELYHLPADPWERTNLFASDDATVHHLAGLLARRDDGMPPSDRAFLTRTLNAQQAGAGGGLPDAAPPALLQQLRSLGYL